MRKHSSSDHGLRQETHGQLRGMFARRYRPVCALKWNWRIVVKRLDTARVILDDDDAEYDGEEFVGHKILDEKGYTWPFPDEQMQWLLNLLNNLDAEVLKAVKEMDEIWSKTVDKSLKKLDLSAGVTHDDRKLTSLDLAFFGRLLVFMNEHEQILGFTPPPYPFPDSLEME